MVDDQDLDSETLLKLNQRTDELGVLSVFVHTDPSRDQNLQAVGIDLKNRYRELQRRVTEDGGHSRGREVAAALERLWPQVEGLASPPASARSHFFFAGLDGDWVVRFDSPMDVANRVVLDDGPFIHPLLELLDEGRPAGVVVLSTEEARILEWRLGSLQMVSRLEQEYVEAPHERAGPIGGGPTGQLNTPMREQRKARDRKLMNRFVDRVVKTAGDLAATRGWERILISGGEYWTEQVIARFPEPLREAVFGDSRILSGLDDTALAAPVTDLLREYHTDNKQQLVERMREAVGAGAAAVGLSEVAAALTAGRVAHLVYDPEVRYAGSVGADGALYAGDEVAPGDEPGTPDPRLTERLVERALETGARVSPVEGAAAGPLQDANGIAALLRW